MKNELSSYRKLFFVLNFLVFSFLVLFFLSLFVQKITAFNQDLGRHLILGGIIFELKTVPLTNHFSYTYPDFPFINHHWFAEVIFYLSNKFFGQNFLIWLKVLVCFAAFFALLFKACKTYCLETSLSWGLLLLILFGQRNEVRPEIFSYLFLSLYLLILNRPQSFKKFFWVLPIVQILWVNSHIYFFLGPLLLFLYFLNFIFSSLKKKRFSFSLSLYPFVTLSLSILACLLNPNFLKGALYPLFVFNNYGYRIVENQSISFMSHYYGQIYNPYFILLFLLSFLTFLVTFRKQNFYTLTSFIFFSLFSFLAIRNIPLFALGLLIPVSRNLFLIKNFFVKKVSNELRLNFKLLFYFVMLVFLLLFSWQNITNADSSLAEKRFGLGKIKGAQEGADFIINNKIVGPMFNNFDIGSYLIYRLYPGKLVFVDGRPEAYPASFLKNVYIPMQERQDKWAEQDSKYHFNFVFFSHTDITPWATVFLQRISQDRNWQLVFLDDFSIIFVENNELNKQIVSKYLINKNNFHFDCQKQLDCAYRMSRILNTLGWLKQN